MPVFIESVVVAASTQTSCELSGETVILDFNRGEYYGLDEIGTLIWRELQRPRPVRALCDTIAVEYDVDRNTCEQDVIRLLERLHAEGLVEIREPLTT